MSVKGLSMRGIANTYNVDLGEMLEGESLPLRFLLDKDNDYYFNDFISEGQIMRYNHSIKKKSIEHVNEATKTEILKEADSARKNRAKRLIVRYKGVTNRYGWITFHTNSQYTPGRKYTQYVKLKEAKDMKYFKEFNKRDIIRLFMSGDLQVHCTCPDYNYRHKYQAHMLGYGIYRETRFPHIRNPKLEGSVCKHLIAVLGVMNNNWMNIAKDMQKSKFFKKKYEEDED